MQHRTEAQWLILLDEVISLEDASRFANGHTRSNVWWPPSQRN